MHFLIGIFPSAMGNKHKIFGQLRREIDALDSTEENSKEV
jgi:hypothetical protein